MKNQTIRTVTIFTALVLISLPACRNELAQNTVDEPIDVQTIWFGVYTSDKATSIVEKFSPTIKDLEKRVSEKLDRKVQINFKVAAEYKTGIEQIVNGEVQFSRLGPASSVIAKRQNPQLKLLAMDSKKGERLFSGIIAIHQDSKLSSIEDLRGGSFAFGDPLSTIGRYLSQSLLLQNGLTGKDFETFAYLGRHDSVGMAVGAKDFTAGALKESTFNKLVEAGEPIKVLTTFNNVTKPWVAHPDLKLDTFNAIQESLLEMQTSSVSNDGFLSADDSFYEPVRLAMDEVTRF